MSRHDAPSGFPGLNEEEPSGFDEGAGVSRWEAEPLDDALDRATAGTEPSSDTAVLAPSEPDPSSFLVGADAVRAFVAREWKRRLDYRMKKEVWSYSGNRVSILFEYEWHDAETDQWMLTHGEEHWEIAADGLLHRVKAAGQDVAIAEIDRWILPRPVMARSAAD